MRTFELTQLIRQQGRTGKPYLEFLRLPEMSLGVYQLLVGDTDPQLPHTEDEVYYIVSGKAHIKVADEDHSIREGSIVYIPKNVVHRFHSIEEDLIVLVFFSPAEYSLRGKVE